MRSTRPVGPTVLTRALCCALVHAIAGCTVGCVANSTIVQGAQVDGDRGIDAPSTPVDQADDGEAVASGPVEVEPLARDDQIAERLQKILDSTEWFESSEVSVDNGVVFLRGQTDRTQYKEWATKLAQQTQDVVAVVNRIELVEGPIWDLAPASAQLVGLWRGAVQSLPLLIVGLAILVIALVAARYTAVLTRHLLARRVQNQLLRDVTSKAIAVPVLLVGVYVVLHIAGLTRLALTVLGGTGLAGLIIGIAFRDIAENFLASLPISIQNPLRAGDLIEVD